MVRQEIRERRESAKTKLQYKGFAFNASSSTIRLEQLAARARLDPCSYEKCTVDELREFCVARELPIPKRGGKARLTATLENADDNPHFKGFSDLPAELRVLIYEFHYQSVYKSRKRLLRVKIPPVARTSRLLRKESLPIFYDMARFPIALYSDRISSRNEIDLQQRFQIEAPETVISQVKKIMIRGVADGYQRLLIRQPWAWEIDLAKKGQEASVRCSEKTTLKVIPPRPNVLDELDFLQNRTEKMFRDVLDKMAAREGGMKLTRADIKAFAEVLPSFYGPIS